MWFFAQCPLLRVAFLDHPTSDGPSCRHHYQSCYPRQPWNCGFTTLFIICLLHYNGSSIRTGNLAALRCPQHVEQRLAHSRRSINLCGMNRVRRGQLSQCAKGPDGPGSCKPLPGPALGKQHPLRPDSRLFDNCLPPDRPGQGRHTAKAPGFPGTSNRGSHASGRACVKEQVKKLPKQARGKSEEVVGHRAAGPFRGRAGRSGREALAHPVGSFPGRAWPRNPVLVAALVLTCRRTSDTCHLWASVSSPVNKRLEAGRWFSSFRGKKKGSGILSLSKILLEASLQESYKGGPRFKMWSCRILPTPHPLALQSSPGVKTTKSPRSLRFTVSVSSLNLPPGSSLTLASWVICSSFLSLGFLL